MTLWYEGILAGGTLIVVIQSRLWLSREDTAFKEGEFYMLVASTLLGMNMMMSAGHFLMFFLGLETLLCPENSPRLSRGGCPYM